MNKQFEQEEDEIERAYQNGEISQQERNKQLRELQRDWAAAAEQSALDAYEEELGRW